MEQLFNSLKNALEQRKLTDEIRELLSQSMYYFCSGVDPTPIIAFKSSIPLYIYVDSFEYLHKGFMEALDFIYESLEERGFSTVKASRVHLNRADITRLVLLKDDNGKEFLLFFVKADGNYAFDSIYEESIYDRYGEWIDYRCITPKYISNRRYEMEIYDALFAAQNNAEYVFGRCYNPEYSVVGEYDYFGEYDDGTKVKLYRRPC